MSRIRLFIFSVLVIFASVWTVSVWAAYADRTTHESGDKHIYKHPNNRSFTGPFDYAPTNFSVQPKPAPGKPAGKCNVFIFDATQSHDIDNDELTVAWDFGDGTTSDEPIVTHEYAQAGDYTVTLTVRDSSGQICDTGTDSTVVSANFPAIAVAGPDKRTCVGDPIEFDASGSSASVPPIYQWDFGDGQTDEGLKVTHRYEEPGTYKVILTVDDGKDTDCSIAKAATTATVYERPTILISGAKTACTGRTVSFSAQGSAGLRYRWDFGDGTVFEGGPQASHVYQQGGTYQVTVTGNNGLEMPCSIVTDSLQVAVNSTPIADAGENLACCVDKSVTFDGSKSMDPDGGQLKYFWDFGDGERAEGPQVSHTFVQSGNYRVVLTVQDDSGSDCGVASDSFVARVNTGPEAIIQVR